MKPKRKKKKEIDKKGRKQKDKKVRKQKDKKKKTKIISPYF